ncbi:hypothetical protein HDU97_006741 [Phlyctochytrium planicorne]|nr:hypothetical protein HDU97_006741 [Phlyctochytrium planicorne]
MNSNILVSRSYAVVDAFVVRDLDNHLASRSTCNGQDGYYCCPDNPNLACQDGWNCDVANQQCTKTKVNVAAIAGGVVGLVIVIAAIVAGCCYYKKRKAGAAR